MKLKAPPHTADAHIGGLVFTVDKSGFVEVPEDTPSEVVASLIGSGFTKEDVSASEPKGSGAKTASGSGKTSGE